MFSESTEGQLYVDNNTDRLVISNDKFKTSIYDGPYKEISIDDLSIKAEVSYITEELKYVGIYERTQPDSKEAPIEFMRTAGSDVHGIVYLKDGTEWGMITEEIRDGWFYYWIGR